ncbi:glycosyltransferase family 2 protein [Novosphingobium sp. KACC 22771]|uniref:glycosyltransferase family 2 protein n=1 Tax=Novosphingobium sp. KACC 22771 TaxID=3025670 RepID=UPI00236658FD|nr:glycosyltransferase family 2 protein [Novosphingobium sp. KACC 22771]WDF71908.1 glycosyltransferase family 2 protein [Novosphingobium sp. KACC 22771]
MFHTALRRPKLAAEALYWRLTGRKARARNRLRACLEQGPNAYRDWIALVERRAEMVAKAAQDWPEWPVRPRLSVILYQAPGETSAQVERRLASLEAQAYGDWELVLAQSREAMPTRQPDVPRLTLVPGRTDNPAKALIQGMECATGDYILPLAADTLLAPDALYQLARAVVANPDAGVFYGDEDRISRKGLRSHPWFKPRWNPDLFLAHDYVSGACLIRRADALATPPLHPALSAAGVYAMLIHVTAQTEVVHVPRVIAHRGIDGAGNPDALAARAAAVAHHVAPLGASTRIGAFGTVAVDWPMPEMQPLVSIIIPTRDQVRLLRKCVTGVLNATRYRNIEILIIDNGSVEAETLDYFARVSGNPRVRVIRHDAPFNWSVLNNLGAREARGEYLCLLNNDIEITEENWLSTMVRQAVRPGVGAVGAKLLYPDGTIQHAGVVIGLGKAAGHAHRFQPNGEPGYFARAHAPHRVSAVTGACLLVSKAAFRQVGGLDEEGFSVAFNDVDLCLKLQAAGYYNIYEPRAVLIHHESKSRARDTHASQVERYQRELALLQERWGTATYTDPLHHPALDPTSETYRIAL